MLNIIDIQKAHETFTGPDFPKLLQAFKEMGMVANTVSLEKGLVTYTDLLGDSVQQTGYQVHTLIALQADKEQAQADLKAHQSGQTTFPTFCEDMAKSGIAYWTINLEAMTCTYYDQNDKAVIIENIPSVSFQNQGENAMSLTLSDLQDYLANHYGDDRDEQGFFMKLVEEVGEVAELLNKRAKRKSSGSENLQEELGKELADLIHYVVAIATVNQIDLTSVIIEKDRSAALKYQHEENLETFLSKLHSNL